MIKQLAASLAGNWVFVQNNGGPKLDMHISKEGVISLTMNGNSLPSFQGAAYAGNVGSDGHYPVIMSIFDTSPSNPMSFSITNYTGVLILSDAIGGDILKGTAIGVQNDSSVETFEWSAFHLNL